MRINMNPEATVAEHLQDIKRNWLIAVGLKALFCVLSLQVILNLGIWKILLVGFLPLLGRFIIIGFLVPLCVMIWYLWYGYQKVIICPELKKTIGDSAYFLGFLFTIASIIAAMGDMALTNMQDGTMTYVASRFALAMITTLLGMTYRTYLTEFDPDEEDAAGAVSRGASPNNSAPYPNLRPDATPRQNEDARDTPEDTSNKTDQPSAPQPPSALPSRGGEKRDDEYAVSLVIKAISDDEVFRKLQDTMNQAIHSFNDMATNAVTVKNKLEAAAQVLVDSTGSHLKNSVTQMMDEASKIIIDSATKMASTNQELIEKNQKQLEEHAVAQKALMQDILTGISNSFNNTQRRNAAITEETQAALRAGLDGIAPIFQESARKLAEEQHAALAILSKATQTQRQSIDTTLTALNTATQELQTNIENLKSVYKSWNDETTMICTNVKESSKLLNRAYNRLANSLGSLSGTLNTTQNGVTNELMMVQDNVAKLKEFATSLSSSASTYNGVKFQFDKIVDALSAAEGKYQTIQEKFENNLTRTAGLIDKLPEVTSSLNTAAQEFNGSIDYLNKELVKTNKDIAAAANRYMMTKDSIKPHKSWWQFWK